MLHNALKFLIKDTAIYGIAGAITKFIALFSVPIVARVLTKDEFGTLNTIIAITVVFSGFITLGQDSSVARWFFDKDKSDKEYKVKVVSTGFLLQLTATVIFAIVFFFFHGRIGTLIFKEDYNLIHYWEYYIFALPGGAFLLFSNNVFKWTFQRNKYLFLTLGNSISTILLTLVFILVYDMGIFGAIIAPVISVNLFSVISLVMNRNYIKLTNNFDKELIIQMLKYGLPFSLIAIVAALLPSMDRLFLIRYVNMDVIGEYSVSLKIASLLMLITGAFQISFGPYAYSIWKKPEAPKVLSELFTIYLGVLLVIGTTMTVFGKIGIQLFAGEQYVKSILVLPFILLAYAIRGLNQFSTIGINWSKKSYFNVFSILIQLAVLLVFNFLLTEKFKIFGAAGALLISNLVYVIFTFIISNMYYKIKIDITKSLVIISLAVTVHSIVLFDFYYNSSFLTIAKFATLIVYYFILYFIILNRDQRLSVALKVQSVMKLK